MYPTRYVVCIDVRSMLEGRLVRTAQAVIVATTPQRAAGHRSVWEMRQRLCEGLKCGDWYFETTVVAEQKEARHA